MAKIIFILAVLFAGCKNEMVIMDTASQPKESFTRIDTILVAQNAFADRILISELETLLQPDSTGISKFRIAFHNGDREIHAFHCDIPFHRDRSYWISRDEVFVDTIADNLDRRFVILSNGFEACGYPQYSFLFYIDNKIELIDQWVSVSDGGLGTWREFFPLFAGSRVIEFRHRMLNSEEIDGPAGEAAIEIAYRDSTVVRNIGGKWIHRAITAPDLPYRTEVLQITEYFK